MKSKVFKIQDISLFDVIKLLNNEKRYIIFIIGLALVIGLLKAFLTPQSFKSSSKIIVVSGSNELPTSGGISAIAGLAGINLNNNQGTIIPLQLYSEIVKSTPFLFELINSPLYFPSLGDSISYDQYLINQQYSTLSKVKKYTINIPRTIKKAIFPSKGKVSLGHSNDSQFLDLSFEETQRIKILNGSIDVAIDEESGMVTVNSKMPEPAVSAQMTRLVKQRLEQEVIQKKIAQQSLKVEYLEQRYLETKQGFVSAQLTLARFNDSNQNLSSDMARTEVTMLEDEYNLAYSLYKEIAQQLETAKIELKNETPIFSTIEPVSVPVVRHSPKRTIIMFISLFLGVFCAIGFVLGKYYWSQLKLKWEKF